MNKLQSIEADITQESTDEYLVSAEILVPRDRIEQPRKIALLCRQGFNHFLIFYLVRIDNFR